MLTKKEIEQIKKLPRGFKPLSERYPQFPVLLSGRISMLEIKNRWWVSWRPLQWMRNQITEAKGEPPKWLREPSPFMIVLIDGRWYPFTAEEKERYFYFAQIHQKTIQLSAGAEVQRESYKKGAEN